MATRRFNLEPPPGFLGLDLQRPITVYERNLPHWRQAGATYFVTFHLADALPVNRRNELAALRREWELRYPPPRDEATSATLARDLFRKLESWMDAGYGACWFQRAEYADELQRAILHFHGERYEIGCFAVMANHCHLTMRPLVGFDLELEVGRIKSITSRFVKEREILSGALWHQESYDRIVRDDEHLYRVVQYIGSNPSRAGVPRDAWRRWFNPDWQALGWDFHDEPS